MSWRFPIGLFTVMITSGFVIAPSEAQQPYWQRDSMVSNSTRSAALSRDALDRFQPYTSSKPRKGRTATPYRSESKPVPPELTRTNYYAQRRDYFPGLRTGQGPNRNSSHGGHCVPSRITVLSR